MERSRIALAGIILVLGPGALYAFSTLAQPVAAAFGWSSNDIGWAFGIGNACLALGAAIGGGIADRFGPRAVAIIGSILWGAGNIASGLLLPAYGLTALYLCYGVVGGIGVGMAFIAAVSAVVRWFPAVRGFGGGLVVMGFGFGAFIFSFALTRVPGFAGLASDAATFVQSRNEAAAAYVSFDPSKYALNASGVHLLLTILIDAGIVFAVVGIAASFFLANPPVEAGAVKRGVTPGAMLANPQFYILWAMLFLNSTAGIIIIANAPAMMQELTGETSAIVFGIATLLSLCTGIGPLIWGALSDRIGRRASFAALLGLQVLAFFTMAIVHSLPAVAASFAVVLLCYSGAYGMMPAYSADYFGMRSFGANFGLTVTALGLAALVGPLFIQLVKGFTGTYAGALQPVAIMLSVAIVFPIISETVRSARRREPTAAA